MNLALGQISPAVGRGVNVCVGVIVGVLLLVGVRVSVIVGVTVAVLVGEGVNVFISTKGDGMVGLSSGPLAKEQALRESKAKNKAK